MKVSEILGAGLWAASAVQVTRYTWQALSGQYEKFPDVNGGGGGGGILGSIGSAISGAAGAVSGAVNGAIGGTLTPGQKSAGKKISSEPGNGRFGPVG